ncbi:hypothetical protein L6654_05120 [Bradyrhizobium sp. WYCCWR 13023]|uniref:Uncharacterized protein n=1 Tax=Bradyrhizobium zhengyangense TaxID=2911009 RepID=A0A9X1R7N2_9BRAD|nr:MULTISPECIES: hypothetical protein [Bradyrhizobium]MCG2626003.1 hypothetical protein [Bradyrhizobium zhengyangense]MCG2645254.1 hypothetical protein [Bradyrhizobium zhengyangense]MCG2671452.1 hypothetical protein [Bradyrhizobium zhengyangense]
MRAVTGGLVVLRQIAGLGGKVDGAAIAVNEVPADVAGLARLKSCRSY